MRANKIIFVVGKKSYGKSYFVKTKILPTLNRKIIFDVMSEYDLEENKDAYYALKIDTFYAYSFDDFFDYFSEKFNENFSIVLRLDSQSELEQCLKLIYKVGHCSLIIEEIHLLDSGKDSILHKMYTTGRHKNINIVGVSQRFSNVSRTFTSQCDYIISFRQTEPLDLKIAKEINAESAAKLAKLDVGEFLILQN